jgi:large conductance mechanosensitive channel
MSENGTSRDFKPMENARRLIADPTKKAFTLFDEFKRFALKGNVVDLAIGVIIGGAFGKIVEALVKSIIMPLVGLILPGQQGYAGWKLVVNGKEIPYGIFLSEVVNFVIVAMALWIFLVKFLGWITRNKKQESQAPRLTKDQELLTEIRDALRGRPSVSS